MRRVLATILVCVCCAAIPALADTIIVGAPATPDHSFCYPFGCAFTGEYQQIYTHSLFPGPITITGLEFFSTVDYSFHPTAMNSGLWTISLSTTSVDWNTMSHDFASNIGADDTQVFSGDLAQPWAFGDTLHIDLTTPFTYDPNHGNLLMTVNASNTSDANGIVVFDVNLGNDYTTRGYTYCGHNCVDVGAGLVTGFNTAAPTVPEPGTLLLLCPGVLGLAGALRRRSRQVVGSAR